MAQITGSRLFSNAEMIEQEQAETETFEVVIQ